MKNLNKLLDLKKFSIFIIFTPYLILNFPRILNSPLFEFNKLFIALMIIIFFDSVFKIITSNLNNKISWILSLIILFLSILFLYGFYITSFIQEKISYVLNFFLRGRYIVGIYSILSILFLFTKPRSFKVFNTFLIVLSLSLFINSSFSNTENERTFKNNFLKLTKSKNDSIKPIILLITDEYCSPDEIFKYKKDSIFYEFSKKLKNQNWIVKNTFYSHENSTIHSLSSLFNYNLSKDTTYKQQSIINIGLGKLLKSGLYDSLIEKNVELSNYGIFNIGNSRFYKRMYFYPMNFTEDLFYSTSFFAIKDNTNSFEADGFKGNYYPNETYNKSIFNELYKIANENNTKDKTFIYGHLLMPHTPYQFLPDFSYKSINIDNYVAYWNFTNYKLMPLIQELTKINKFRIIITGDHGFRSDSRINPYNTFSAFYGFDKNMIDSIKSVQDLGSLINACF